jgi:hypothetical protein
MFLEPVRVAGARDPHRPPAHQEASSETMAALLRLNS